MGLGLFPFSCSLQITHVHVVPPMLHMLATDPIVDQYDLSTLQSITCAAAPLDAKLAQQCQQRLNIKDLRQCKIHIYIFISYIARYEERLY